MHALELIMLAATVASQGRQLIRSTEPWVPRPLNDYWCISKIRLDRWYAQLRKFSNAIAQEQSWSWQQARPVVEEILASEILTRVWAAAATARDRYAGTCEAEPLVRSILIGHLEARNRALRLLLYAPGVAADDAVELNALRSQTERWTDLLIGSLLAEDDVAEFAVDPERARDFAQDFEEGCAIDANTLWSTLIASMRQGFTQSLTYPPAQPDLNRQIYQSVAYCLNRDDWSLSPLAPEDWLQRIEQLTETTAGLILQLESEYLRGPHVPAPSHQPLV
jgi:hypothetical protein